MNHKQNPGLVAQVAEKLLAMGFTIVTARFGDAPCITVLATQATRQLESHYKGQGFDGRCHYRTYAALVDGVQVEWHRPQVAPAIQPRRWQTRRPWRTLTRKALH
ncbi:MAG: hypothetical protein WC284_18230 [Candidimonas sp.]